MRKWACPTFTIIWRTTRTPDFLFTPDAEFPVCNAEKGQFGATFVSSKIDGGRIVSWSGAEASNAIPSQSICDLAIAADELPAPIENADRLEITALDNGHGADFRPRHCGHASMPEGTINAVGLIVAYLREAEDAFGARDERLLTPAEHEFVKLLAFVHADAYGRGLGIDATNAAFGPLTCNPGVIRVVDGHIEQVIDVRFPDSTSADTIRRAARAARGPLWCDVSRGSCQGAVLGLCRRPRP